MLYPVNLHIKGKHCVIVGGGETALRKVRSLLAAEAMVTVIAKSFLSEFAVLAETEPLTIKKQTFSAADVRETFIVICATDDETVNREAALSAKKAGALVNMAAPPLELSDIDLPAVSAVGDLLLAVSTGGRSPELAKRMKERLSGKMELYSEWLEIIAPYRERCKQCLKSSKERQSFWRLILSDEMFDLVENGELGKAEERIKNALDSFGA